MADLLIGFGCFFLLAGVIMDVISVATNHWTIFSDISMSGLWLTCTDGSFMRVKDTDRLDSVRAMMVLSIIVSGIALVTTVIRVVHVCNKNNASNWTSIVASIFSFFAALLALIGILIYHSKIWKETARLTSSSHRGYSFWLGVASIVTFFIAGVFFLNAATLFCTSLEKHHDKNNIPFNVSYHKRKPKSPDNGVHRSGTIHGNLDNGRQISEVLPYVYYSTTPIPPGIYSADDIRIINVGYHDSPYSIPRPSVSHSEWTP